MTDKIVVAKVSIRYYGRFCAFDCPQLTEDADCIFGIPSVEACPGNETEIKPDLRPGESLFCRTEACKKAMGVNNE